MSAQEIIEQIKTLPLAEKAEVVKFVHQLGAERPVSREKIHYSSPEQAKAAGDQVVRQYEEVFRKLSQ